MGNKRLQSFLEVDPALDVAIRGDVSGNILEVIGDTTGEEVYAATTLGAQHLMSALASLGMNYCVGWTFSTSTRSVYVMNIKDGAIVVVGKASSNPQAVLQKLSEELRS